MLTSFADGRVFGVRTGANRPRVLALHGWRGSHEQMAKVVEGFDAISLDLPGFGASPLPDAAWGAREYAEALAPVLDELQAPAVLVGYSFGGRVAVNLASLYPEKIHALVLTGTPLIRRAPSKKTPLVYRLAKQAHRLGLISDEKMEAERRKRGSADYRAATGLLRDIFVRVVNESYETQLQSIGCPVEMVWGDADTEAPLAQAREAEALLAHVHFTVVPGGTHWMPMEHPQPIRDALEKVLS